MPKQIEHFNRFVFLLKTEEKNEKQKGKRKIESETKGRN